MTDQEILDNAPDGATHVDMSGRWHKLTYTHKGFMLLNNDGDWDYCNPCTNLRSLADIKRIVELENPWISVKDRLPDVDKFLIANFRNRPSFIAKAWKFTVHNRDGRWCKYTGGGITLIEHNTHWMPLPESPKEKSE